MTNNELLLAISNLLDKKFEPMENRMQGLDEHVQVLEERMQGVDEHLQGVDERMQVLEDHMQVMDDRLQRMELSQENNILPRLQNIESCYTTTYSRYKESVDNYDSMRTDIDILKKVVAEHSLILQRIS